jgi:phenylacetate-coenzyme A ligase PaaK-like adenylate-forming protein
LTLPSSSDIFKIDTEERFNEISLEVFQYQAKKNAVYKRYIDLLGVNPNQVSEVESIPFMPIELFKTHEVVTGSRSGKEILFTSSGTTGTTTSKHYVQNIELYKKSFSEAFRMFYGAPEAYRILALLPSYMERGGSSLIYMVDDLVKKSNHPQSGFFLDNLDDLRELLLLDCDRKTLLIGVSFALLDLIEVGKMQLKDTIVMETGGMKGRRKEVTRQELHEALTEGCGIEEIHSEYGMTELLSQAYSRGQGTFLSPPWMKVIIRDPNDALTILPQGKSGGINVIDLANLYSCAFLATSDLGKVNPDGSFEILGRFDHSDIRGCNLLVAVD